MRVLLRVFLVAMFPIVTLSGVGSPASAAPHGAATESTAAIAASGAAREQPTEQRVCVVSPQQGQRCFNTVAAYRTAMGLRGNQGRTNGERADECPADHLCLYREPMFDAPLVSIHENQGLYKLPDWARDSASSYENNANCATIRDYDWPFNHSDIVYSSTLANLWEHPHPEGGTWDNRVDEVEMSCG